MQDDINIIFIVGVGRSGTSLLQRMMNAHPNIRILPEIHFFKQYLSSKNERDEINRAGYKAFIDRLSKDKWFARLGIDAADVDLGFIRQEDFDITLFYRKLMWRVRTNEKEQFIGEKDPRLLELSEEIGRVCPAASIIHIVRDPRDVMLSKLKASWSEKRGFILNLLLTQAQLSYGRRIANAETKYKEIFYEDLISHPKDVLTAVCDFLGIPFNADMLDYYKYNDGLIASDEMQWKKNAMKPVIGDNTNKWVAEFSDYQVALIEKICRSAFSGAKYQKSGKYNTLSTLGRLRIVVTMVASYIFTILYPIVARNR